jgi:hypothetical protein
MFKSFLLLLLGSAFSIGLPGIAVAQTATNSMPNPQATNTKTPNVSGILRTAKYWTFQIEKHGGQIPDFSKKSGILRNSKKSSF